MAGERSFLVKILGNADGAITAFKNLAREGQESFEQVQSIGNKIGAGFDVVKKAAFIAIGAFTAVAGAATAAALAAAEDEKSQRELASQLQRTTDASNTQIASVEAFIKKAMLATGVVDTELRSAFGNLVRATGDATTSQRLFSLALDISAATGKDLESVTIGLGKAANGQVTALAKLGIPIDENVKKSKDFNAALIELERQFGGASAAAADTFSGRLAVVKVTLGEVVESIGFALLPFFEKMVAFIQKNILPALVAFSDHIGKDGLVLSIGFALNAMGDLGMTFVDVLEQMTMATLTFLKNFADLGRTIALTVGFTAALTGNVPLALKATAASLAFKAVQGGLNTALTATPALFDKIRAAMATAQQAQARALPNIIGTADALERAIGIPKTNIIKDTFTGAGAAVKTAQQKLDDFKKSLQTVTSETKSFASATKSVISAKKELAQRILDVGKREADVTDANINLVKRQGDAVKANLEITKRQGELGKRNADVLKKEGDLIKRNVQLVERQLDVTKRRNELAERNVELAKAQEDFNKAVAGYGKNSSQAEEAGIKLAEAQRSVEQSGYRVEKAFFAITAAEKSLASVRSDTSSTAQDIRDAEIELAEAKLNLADAQADQVELNKEQKDSQSLLDQAISGSVVGSELYEDLLGSLKDAQEAQKDATANLAQAFEDLAGAQEDVTDAQQDILDAKEAVVLATEAVKDAEEDLADAIRDVGKAQQEIIDAKQAVIDAMDAVADAHTAIQDAVDKEAEAYRELEIAIKKAAAAAGIAGKKFVAPVMPVLSTITSPIPSTVVSLPPVPTPNGATGVPADIRGSGGPSIVINTGLGTNGVEAGRQIVEVLQQYSRIGGNNFLEFAVA